jgi:hypothetical protein
MAFGFIFLIIFLARLMLTAGGLAMLSGKFFVNLGGVYLINYQNMQITGESVYS